MPYPRKGSASDLPGQYLGDCDRQSEISPRVTRAAGVRSPSARKRQPYITDVWPTCAVPFSRDEHKSVDPEQAELVASTDFRILELPRPFATPPGIELPPFDEYGWPTGRKYSPLLEARTPSLATRAITPNFKFARQYEALSMGEFGIQLALAFNPYVVDLREQYGIYDPADYWRAVANGRTMNRSRLMTIDIVVTYVLPPHFELHHHAISIKHARHRHTDSDQRRELRERAAMARRGWTWELMRSDTVPRLELENYAFLWVCIRRANVQLLYERAHRFSEHLKKRSMRGSMNVVLERVARGLGIRLDDAYRLFSAAVAYGFLTLDHTKRLNDNLPIFLLQ